MNIGAFSVYNIPKLILAMYCFFSLDVLQYPCKIILTEQIMEKIKIDRINELGRIAKERELTAEELEERKALREEYLNEVRRQLRGEEGKK